MDTGLGNAANATVATAPTTAIGKTLILACETFQKKWQSVNDFKKIVDDIKKKR